MNFGNQHKFHIFSIYLFLKKKIHFLVTVKEERKIKSRHLVLKRNDFVRKESKTYSQDYIYTLTSNFTNKLVYIIKIKSYIYPEINPFSVNNNLWQKMSGLTLKKKHEIWNNLPN